jgi:hypothetical protein
MRRRQILALVVIAVLFGSLVCYRLSLVPSLLTLSVSLDLYRIRDDSYQGKTPSFSVYLTTTNMTSNNVTFVENPYSNKSLTSEAYWKLQVISNESKTTKFYWECNIDPGLGSAGRYAGVVSYSFVAKGDFKVWIVLWSVDKASNKVLWWTSETVRVLTSG